MNDFPFKVAVIVLLVLMKAIRWPYRRQIDRKASWPAMKKHPLDTAMLGVLATLWSIALILYMGFPQHIAFGRFELPEWVRWAGVAMAAATLAFLAWSDHSLGKNLSVTLKIRENHTLVTSGPYRRISHPIYTGALLFSATFFPITANWFIGLLWLGGLVLLCATRIPQEERMMIAKFGDRYRDYMQWTGRLLPRFAPRTRPPQ